MREPIVHSIQFDVVVTFMVTRFRRLLRAFLTIPMLRPVPLDRILKNVVAVNSVRILDLRVWILHFSLPSSHSLLQS
jgi:hypothetical protein